MKLLSRFLLVTTAVMTFASAENDPPGRVARINLISGPVSFRPGGVELLADAGWLFKAHMFLGMSIFLVFPFTRLVHVWSGFGTLAYAIRPYQTVRSRRLNLPRAKA